MQLPVILFMLGGGAALALFVMGAMAFGRRSDPQPEGAVEGSIRESVEGSLLFHVLTAGGIAPEAAIAQIRADMGSPVMVTRGIDVASWAENYTRNVTELQRAALLERAVRLVAAVGKPVPLRQYAALLDLSFGLGFQTDALARLRDAYGFDYIDHARDGRPRGERPGAPQPTEELLSVLGLRGEPTRHDLGLAYRKLVAKHHPDRFHDAPPEARDAAATRFIEITRAYEKLLFTIRD